MEEGWKIKCCDRCKETKPLAEFYHQKKKSKTKGEYIYYRPECKDCTKRSSTEWNEKNIDKKRKYARKYNKSDIGRRRSREASKRRRDNGEYYEWLKKNSCKVEIRKHDISDKEWIACKEYFDNSCAYCGMSEEEHKTLYKQHLHKEHVDHEGANDLSNCVPACKHCNSSKHAFELDYWYTNISRNFSSERINKVRQWLNNDYKLYVKSE